MRKAFTLVELLIVIGIISTLAAMQTFVYLNSQKSARDGRRKADLENIRAALEQYRSSNNSYPASLTFNASCAVNGALTDGSNTYMNPLPSDPRCQLYKYNYIALPAACTTACTDYALGANLEVAPIPTCAVSLDCINSTGVGCNHCVGPYGTK